MYGKPCWNVRAGYGSFLTFEFGKPHLEMREPIVGKSSSRKARELLARRPIFLHGDWHLWIYCCAWEIFSDGNHFADGSTRRGMEKAAEFLNGQKLMEVSLVPRKVLCTFKFDLGGTLKTISYDRRSEQWLLYTPAHRVLILRADRRYQYVHSDMPTDKGAWNPVFG